MNAPLSLPLAAPSSDRKRSYPGIWLALAIALLLHFILLMVPLIQKQKAARSDSKSIDIQITRYSPEPPAKQQAEQQTEPLSLPSDPPIQQAEAKPVSKQPELPENRSLPTPSESQPPLPPAPAQQADKQVDRQTEIQNLSSRILSSQYLTEESVTEKIFGPSVQIDPRAENKAFHFPTRQSMITLLDQPVSDLPFEYTPGLVEFAYDPGVKGDVQRFFDKITPEFGWRTNYGTQVKCKWILVIAACGWGRSDDSVAVKANFLKSDQLESAN